MMPVPLTLLFLNMHFRKVVFSQLARATRFNWYCPALWLSLTVQLINSGFLLFFPKNTLLKFPVKLQLLMTGLLQYRYTTAPSTVVTCFPAPENLKPSSREVLSRLMPF